MSEHSGFQDVVWIGDFDSRPNGARTPINFVADIGDMAGKGTVRIGVDRNLRQIASPKTGEVVLKDISYHPYAFEIDYREWRRIVSVNYPSDPQIAFHQSSRDRRDER